MRIVLGWLFAAVLVWGADATIEVTKKVDSLPSIAVEDASINYTGSFSKGFFKALVGDLNVLSLFNVDRHYTTTHFNNSEVNPANEKFDYVLRYRLQQDDNGAFVADAKLMGPSGVVMSKRYSLRDSAQFPFLVHAIAYDVNDKMGAPSVEWMKRKIVLSRLVGPHKSEILIADYTLSYQKPIIVGGLNVFPKWADRDQTSLYFTNLDGRKPTLYHIDVTSGKRQKVISSDGMMVCSDVSKDGARLLLTMAPDGQPDVYLYDVATRSSKRLTTYSGIDVNGQFMDGNRIAFVSNRMGYPNIYSKVIGGKGVEQMVYYGKSNSTCSAYGDYIVYKARESSNAFADNTFNLHLISTKSDFIRRLTATGINEFPRFSKDGDAVLFIKNYKEQSALGVIRLAHNRNYLFPLSIGKIQSMDW